MLGLFFVAVQLLSALAFLFYQWKYEGNAHIKPGERAVGKTEVETKF